MKKVKEKRTDSKGEKFSKLGQKGQRREYVAVARLKGKWKRGGH